MLDALIAAAFAYADVSACPASLPATLAPTEDQADPEFRAVCMPILDSPEYWRHNVAILPALLRATLQAIADAEPGVLVHCAAGRDRTGMVAAILLANAGVAPVMSAPPRR